MRVSRSPAYTLIGLLALAANASCVSSYDEALGFRARQAALRRDVEAFPRLMAEAVDVLPTFPRDNPEKTVLTHFMALADDPHYFPYIKEWMAKGWIDENLTCAIHRARWKAMLQKDPADAESSAQVCLERARKAADDPDRSWEVEACLDEAPFLSATSTVAIRPYVAMAADPTEPRAFRAGLLRGLTSAYLQDDEIRLMNAPQLPKAVAFAQAEAQIDANATRLSWVLESLQGAADPVLLAAASAQGALELERASNVLHKSYVGDFIAPGDSDHEDLAWGWVRSLKSRKAVRRLERLGIWNRKLEPAGDAYWYLCAQVATVAAHAEAEVVTLRPKAKLADRAALLERCKAAAPELVEPVALGPFPLDVSARATLTSSIARNRGQEHVILHIRRRVVD